MFLLQVSLSLESFESSPCNKSLGDQAIFYFAHVIEPAKMLLAQKGKHWRQFSILQMQLLGAIWFLVCVSQWRWKLFNRIFCVA